MHGIVVPIVEWMKRLFKRADPDMSEEKKLRLLMRGVKQELFASLVRNPPKTVAEFMSEAAAMKKTLNMRSWQYERHVSSIAVNPVDAMGVSADARRETIRAVVKEELKKLFPTTTQPQVAALSDVIREVQQALGTSTSPETPVNRKPWLAPLPFVDLALALL